MEDPPVFQQQEEEAGEEPTYTVVLDKAIEKNLGLDVDRTVKGDTLPI
eukprot:CAMPEP_0194501022 /NCGR_PEP_ID=MMETSP0253-20130528/20834_1 /TAXON_ID=2966 /ORGANISM="Noctiluca scintillans" /LENGTH=47 /DNA_ID= /DNA_START= /DNA_END= /DNA_ORIENTATION=